MADATALIAVTQIVFEPVIRDALAIHGREVELDVVNTRDGWVIWLHDRLHPPMWAMGTIWSIVEPIPDDVLAHPTRGLQPFMEAAAGRFYITAPYK